MQCLNNRNKIGKLLCGDEEKTEIEENTNDKVTINNSDIFQKVQLHCENLERAGELTKTDKVAYYV